MPGKMDRFIRTIFEQTASGLLSPAVAHTLIAEHEMYQKENQANSEIQPGKGIEDVAVIGLSCRLSDSNSTEEFWENLEKGKNLIGDVPGNRWPKVVLSGRDLNLQGGFLRDFDCFDHDFFQLTKQEAMVTDPQQRYVLELSWELLECSGYGSKGSREQQTIGVFVGARGNTYKVGGMVDTSRSALLGQAPNMIAARVSDFLDLKGPAVIIDTACSSSLVSVHMACQSLKNRECNMAIAGGVELLITPDIFIYLNQMKALSPDGQCRTFDKKANGYVPGEGGVLFLLKPLDRALKDRDTIYAVIKGSAVNNDGFTAGVTTPSVESQKQVIKKALIDAGVGAETITLIEAHGTGTFIGDPIEFKALSSVFREYTDRHNYCALGSVKTNIGHLHSAAGAVGLLKVILALDKKKIPAALNFEEANPRFNIISSPFYICSRTEVWQCEGYPRRAGVSAFGFGGTNCHMIVEEGPARPPKVNSMARSFYLFRLSAKNPGALSQILHNYQDYLQKNEPSLPDLCFTANTGRESFSHRLAICCHDAVDLRNKLAGLPNNLQSLSTEESIYFNHVNNEFPPRMVWLFPGQGSQYPAMADELYATEPNFKRALDECDLLFTPHLQCSLVDYLYTSDRDAGSLDETFLTQPLVFAVSYALARVWLSWGIFPSAVMGHSVGEYAAAVIAGVFSLEDAISIICNRSRLMQQVKEKGGMAVVMAHPDEVKKRLDSLGMTDDQRLVIAAYNGPANTVVSGYRESLAEFLHHLKSEGIKTIKLSVSHAFHSPLMEPVLAKFGDILKEIKFSSARIPIVSNVSGDFEEILAQDYWLEQIVNPVQFAQAVEKLLEKEYEIFLEVGPGTNLVNMVKRIIPEGTDHLICSTLHRQKTDWQALWEAVGKLWTRGISVDLNYIEKPFNPSRILLPTYPFSKSPSWVEQRYLKELWGAPPSGESICSSAQEDAGDVNQEEDVLYVKQLDLSHEALINQHVVYDRVIVPGVYLWEMAFSAAKDALKGQTVHLGQVNHLSPLYLDENVIVPSRILLKKDLSFLIESGGNEPAVQHTSGKVILTSNLSKESLDIHTLIQHLPHHFVGGDIYEKLDSRGLHYGPGFRSIIEGWSGDDQVVVKLEIADEGKPAERHYLHPPVLLDGVLQGVMGIKEFFESPHIYAPFYVEEIRYFGSLTEQVFGYIKTLKKKGDIIEIDVIVTDPGGNYLVRINGLHLKLIPEASVRESAPGKNIFKRLVQNSLRKWPRCIGKYDLNQDTLFGEKLEELCGLYVFESLRKLKVPEKQLFSLSEWQSSKGILKKFDPLMKKMMTILQEDWRLEEPEEGNYRIVSSPRDIPGELADRLAEEFKESAVFLKVLRHCLAHYPQVLTGKMNPMQVLFPSGSSAMLAELYELSSPHYELAGEVLLEFVKSLTWGRKLRVLEIGAGTGGLTAGILPSIDGLNLEYYFTDISPLLLDQSKQKFKSYDLSFKILDIEKDPGGQGFEVGSFQCIIAANVLHATRTLKNTFANVKKLMPPQGLLILVETTMKTRFADLVFGLTDSWWNFADSEYRKSSPLLSGGEWADILKKEGFGNVKILAEHASTTRHPLSVIVAQLPDRTPPAAAKRGNESGIIPGTPGEKIADWFYRPLWEKEEMPETKQANIQTLLVLARQHRLHDDILTTLESAGHHIIKVYPGESYQALPGDKYILNPARSEDYFMLVPQVLQKHPLLHGIVHLWACEQEKDHLSDLEALLSSQHTGVISLLFLVQAVVKNMARPNCFVLTAATNVNRVSGQETVLCPEKSTLLGLINSIPHEYGKIKCAFVDVDVDDFLIGRLGVQLLSELRSQPQNQIIAYRKGERYVRKIAQITPPLKKDVGIRFKDGGLYIIAGGMGGIGLEIAHFIARKVKAKIILINRSSFPAPHLWDKWLQEHDENDRVHRKIYKLKQMEALGSEVQVVRGDICDVDQMAQLVSQLKESYPGINGVIHAAGVLQDALIDNMTLDDFLMVLKPKMLGTWVLDHVTREENLDFFILLSGLISYFGNVGQSNHCAANFFEDTYAHYRHYIKDKVSLCINWGIWQETGIVGESTYIDPLQQKGLEAIKTNDGLLAFEEVLAGGYVQVGIAPIEDKLKEKFGFIRQKPTNRDERRPGRKPGGEYRRETPGRKYFGANQLENEISQLLINLLRTIDFLKEKPISHKDSFLDLGLDSLTLVTFTQQFEKHYRLELYPTIFFEYPTIIELSRYLAREYSLAFSKIISQQAGGLYQTPLAAVNIDSECQKDAVAESRLNTGVPEPTTSSIPQARDTDIAIIGISGFFPRAKNISEFWGNLLKGVLCVREIPKERWQVAQYYHPGKAAGKSYCKWAGIVDEIDRFDPLFFNISPGEAVSMDPQQRFFLTAAWEALEDAGYAGNRINGSKTGVFVGVSRNDFESLFFDPSNIYSGLANSESIVANRVSHFMNLKGPSVTINTLCSSSLVAVHMGCQSILTGDCDCAITGGVHFVISPEYYVLLSQMEALSPDGICWAFDKKANGFVSGEGAAVIILKKLKDALRDHDHIYAVIKGTAVNHDGRSGSLSAPNALAQEEVIKQAILRSGVAADTITYIETHGTGTELGDPVEIKGLTHAFECFTQKRGFCGIGSVKTNIGHLEAAAGIAGIIKVIMALKHRELPPTLNFNQLNPYIDLNLSPFFIIDSVRHWESSGHPLRAGISSFGMGGTNAHVILEEAPPLKKDIEGKALPYHILALSARSKQALQRIAAVLRNFIERNRHLDLQDICYTLNAGRKHFDQRTVIVADDLERLYDKLNYVAEKDAADSTPFNSTILFSSDQKNHAGRPGGDLPQLIMVFPDLSAFKKTLNWQFLKEIYQGMMVVKEAVAECTASLPNMPGLMSWPEDFHSLCPGYLLFSFQYALARLWLSWGVSAGRFVGQGPGLYVARVLSGEMSIEEAAALVSDPGCLYEVPGWDLLGDKPSIILNVGPEEALPSGHESKSAFGKPLLIHTFNGANFNWQSIFSALGLLYVSGLDINWEKVDLAYKPYKISLPTYPFEARSYWPKTAVKPLAGPQPAPVNMDCFFHLFWEESDAILSQPEALPGVWLVFSDDLGLANELRRHIESVIMVRRGDGFKQDDDASFQINHTLEKDYVSLFSSLEDNRFEIKGLIHLWSFSQYVNNLQDLSTLEESFYDGIYSLFFIAKTILPVNQPLRLVVVSSFAYPFPAGAGPHAVERSPIAILLNTLSQEEHNIITTALDINPHSYSLEEIGGKIITEINSTSPFPEVCYRGGKRYVRNLKEIDLGAQIPPQKLWKPDGVYIITGGTSGIGAEISRYLARNFSPGLVIIGRTPLPLGGAADEGGTEVSGKVSLVRSLREAGSKVLYFALDIADESGLREAIKKAREEFGHFTGVLHCAGTIDDGLLVGKSFDSFKKVLNPKISGIFLLEKLLKNEPLDFFVSFSSISAIYGSAGQGDYSVANSFMDHFMMSLSNRSNGVNYVTINWSYWQDGGMRPAKQVLRKMEKDGILPLASQAGISALEIILSQKDQHHIVVMPLRDKLGFLNQLNTQRYKKHLETHLSAHPGKNSQLPDNQVSEAALAKTELHLVNVFGEILAMDPSEIDREVNLEDYGMDSLAVKNLLFKLEKYYGQYLEPSLFYQYPSVRSLARYLTNIDGKPLLSSLDIGNDRETAHEKVLIPGAPGVKSEEIQRNSSPKAREYHRIFRSLSSGHISVMDAKEQIIRIIEGR